MFFFYLGVVASAARAGDELSFAAPFDAVAATGDRQVSPAWRAHGSAAVHRNFARLTPDRQSKAGALWSAESVGADQATLELTFRISGQGQHFFGDGLALWLSADRAFRARSWPGGPRGDAAARSATTRPRRRTAISRSSRAAGRRGRGTVESAAGCDAGVRFENRGDAPSTGARACGSPSPPAPRRSRWTRPTTGPGSSARRRAPAGARRVAAARARGVTASTGSSPTTTTCSRWPCGRTARRRPRPRTPRRRRRRRRRAGPAAALGAVEGRPTTSSGGAPRTPGRDGRATTTCA